MIRKLSSSYTVVFKKLRTSLANVREKEYMKEVAALAKLLTETEKSAKICEDWDHQKKENRGSSKDCRIINASRSESDDSCD